MGFRFRKTIKLLPGVRLNITKSGVSSTSIGRPGATLNVGGKRGPRVTVGVPGTGVSYSQQLGQVGRKAAPHARTSIAGRLVWGAVVLLILWLVFGTAARH